MGQGQLSIIIWTTLVVLPYTMLHTKFQGHWSIGSGEEDFLRFLPYMGMAAMLVMWPRSFEQLFFPKGPGGCIWNLVAIGPVVSEEKSFEIVDGRRTTDGRRTDDGRRTTEPTYTISSPGAFGSGELKSSSRRHFNFLLLFFEENKAWLFMWILCLEEDSLETSSLIFSEKQWKIWMSSPAAVIGPLTVNVTVLSF